MVNEFQCGICGAAFGNQEELMSHNRTHMQPQAAQQLTYKCATCGGAFKSQAELHEHNHAAYGQHV